MKAKKISLTLILTIAMPFIGVAVFSHGYDRGYGYGHMMEPGYGNGYMTGPGYGHMGRGYMYDNGYNNIDDLKAWLNLSDEQVKQIIRIDSEYTEKFYDNRSNRDKIYELSKEYDKEFDNILTDAQKKKFNEGRSDDRYGRDYYHGCW